MRINGKNLEVDWTEVRFLVDQLGLAQRGYQLSREGHIKGSCECDVIWDDKGVSVELVDDMLGG